MKPLPGILAALILLTLGSGAQAQVLLNYGGTGGATNSTPLVSGSAVTNYQAVYQNAGATTTAIGTSQPTSTTGTGTTVFASNTNSVTGSAGTAGNTSGYTNIDAFYPTSGTGSANYSVVYDTNGTSGTNTSNPLALGTSSATPNTFGLGTGQTMTYSLDINENYHGISYITFLNPKATDAGSSSPTAVSSTAMLGMSLTFTNSSTTGSLALQGQKSFAASFGTALATVDNTTVAALSNLQDFRLTVNLTNNGNGTDTVSGTISSLNHIGGTAALLATLAPQTITLGTTAGTYDLDNSALALEFGSTGIYNAGNNFFNGNLTLSVVPEPATVTQWAVAGLALGFGYLHRRSRIKQ